MTYMIRQLQLDDSFLTEYACPYMDVAHCVMITINCKYLPRGSADTHKIKIKSTNAHDFSC